MHHLSTLQNMKRRSGKRPHQRQHRSHKTNRNNDLNCIQKLRKVHCKILLDNQFDFVDFCLKLVNVHVQDILGKNEVVLYG